jgi:hypothetical protein
VTTEKYVRVKAAEASMESMYLHGVGISKQRAAILDAIKTSVCENAVESGRSPTEAMDLILLSQYMDMLLAVGANDLIIGAAMPTTK